MPSVGLGSWLVHVAEQPPPEVLQDPSMAPPTAINDMLVPSGARFPYWSAARIFTFTSVPS